MNLSRKTLQSLSKIIQGGQISPYMRREDLEDFFFRVTGQDPPEELSDYSRAGYTNEMLFRLNESPLLLKVFQEYFKPVNFVEVSVDLKEITDYLNQYLRFDGYELYLAKPDLYIIKSLSGASVELNLEDLQNEGLSDLYIESQLTKCEHKILSQDYDGAITNARTLVEWVFIQMIQHITGEEIENDGDLIRLYKKVQKELNLEPSRKDISDSLRQILSGLNSIVNGLASIRNKMSDAHATNYQPSRHHAKLATNAAKTLVDFYFETYKYQLEKGFIKPVS